MHVLLIPVIDWFVKSTGLQSNLLFWVFIIPSEIRLLALWIMVLILYVLRNLLNMTNNFFRENAILLLTTKCNNNCIICQDRGPGGYRREIMKDWPEIKEEIDYFVSRGVKQITIYGGEPFLNKNIHRALDYLSQFGFTCFFSTNARVFSSKRLVKELRKLKEAIVQTTLFSHEEKVHDFLTGVEGSWSETVQGIKNLVEEGIYVGVTIVLTSKNLFGLRETVEFLFGLGVSDIEVSGLVNQGRMLQRPELTPDFDLVKKEIGKVLELVEGKKIILGFEKLPLCVAPREKYAFLFEPQHKKKMLICPKNKEKCVECNFNKECMCF